MRLARLCVVITLLGLVATLPARAVTLWSDSRIEGGAGLFFGPGSWSRVEPLFPVVIRNIGFVSATDFVTPFENWGGKRLHEMGAEAFGIVDGKLPDGSLVNENVETGVFTLAGTRMLPVVPRTTEGKFGGAQQALSMQDGEVIMVMDFAIDLGIGPRGVIRMPFYGTTGAVTVPYSLQTQAGGKGVDQAGPLKSGATVTGRVGDFGQDGYINGTLVAAGVMPLNSPIYPGQPWVMVRNFQTDIAEGGRIFGSFRAGATRPLADDNDSFRIERATPQPAAK